MKLTQIFRHPKKLTSNVLSGSDQDLQCLSLRLHGLEAFYSIALKTTLLEV